MNYLVDIPQIFLASGKNAPIKTCALCGTKLMELYEPYTIEKAFSRNEKTKKYDMVFEYAMCYSCQQTTSGELSKESLSNLKMYFKLYVDFEQRQESMGNPRNFDFASCINSCIITKKPISSYSEFQIGAYFYRDRLLLENPPFAIGKAAIEEIQELISEKTRDFLDGLKDRIFPVDIGKKVPNDFLILL
jgi:hypothetical protein